MNRITLNKILLESDEAFKELKKLASGYDTKKSDWIDDFYNDNEKAIEELVKKYNLDWDDLGSLLMKL